MSRPVGVTASAIVAILGSLFALLFAALAVTSLFIEASQSHPLNTTQSIMGGAAMFTVLAGAGIWTSVGLFRLRSWARTSILVFAAFLAAGSAFSLLMTMAVPIPPEITASTQQGFRGVMAIVWGIPLAIAVWWLIQFNTRSTKAAFASSVAEPVSPRPMSITIIAWANILGTASSLFAILARAPAFFFGAIFNGWSADVVYVLLGTLSLYIGRGMLDLRERARLLAIGWFGLTFLHVALLALVPPLRQRMIEMQRTLPHYQAHPIFDLGVLTDAILVVSAITLAAAIWFLVRNRAAFVWAENARYLLRLDVP